MQSLKEKEEKDAPEPSSTKCCQPEGRGRSPKTTWTVPRPVGTTPSLPTAPRSSCDDRWWWCGRQPLCTPRSSEDNVRTPERIHPPARNLWSCLATAQPVWTLACSGSIPKRSNTTQYLWLADFESWLLQHVKFTYSHFYRQHKTKSKRWLWQFSNSFGLFRYQEQSTHLSFHFSNCV